MLVSSLLTLALSVTASPVNPTEVLKRQSYFEKSYFAKKSPYPKSWIFPWITKDYAYAEGRAIANTNDGGFIVGGYIRAYTESDALLFKLNANGDVQQAVSILGGTGKGQFRQTNIINSVIQTSDGGYLLGGTSMRTKDTNEFYGNSLPWVVKTTSSLAITWSKSYGAYAYNDPISSSDDWLGTLTDMLKTSDGNYLLIGPFLIKINQDGKVLSSVVNSYKISKVTFTPDNGFVGVGFDSNAKKSTVAKFTVTGAVEWSKTYSVDGLTTILTTIQPNVATNGTLLGYVVGGTLVYNENRSSDWLLFGVDATGSITWKKILGGPVYDPANLKFSEESVAASVKTKDGNFLFTGVSESFSNSLNVEEIIAVKVSPAGDVLYQKDYHIGDDNVGSVIQSKNGFAFVGSTVGTQRALVLATDANGDIPNLGQGASIKAISLVVGSPKLVAANVDASAVKSAVPIVSDTGSKTFALSVDVK